MNTLIGISCYSHILFIFSSIDFQTGVVHHKNEECSNENKICHYLQRVMGIVDFIVLSAQTDHLLPTANGHCTATSTAPYINYVAGKYFFQEPKISLRHIVDHSRCLHWHQRFVR